MTRDKAIKEIEAAGAVAHSSMFLKFSFGKGVFVYSFFPNHYENMRKGEVKAHVERIKQELAGARRRPL